MAVSIAGARLGLAADAGRESQRTHPYKNLWTKLLPCARKIAQLESNQWALSSTN